MKHYKTPLALAITCALTVGASTSVYAIGSTVGFETESNDTFLDRNILGSDIRTFSGELSSADTNIFGPFDGATFFDFFTPDEIISGNLSQGTVDSYDLSGYGDTVSIVIDNTPHGPAYEDAAFSGGTYNAGLDTVLGAFDENGVVLMSRTYNGDAINDDGSPAGDGLADALFEVIVPDSGEFNIKVSGFPDFDFDGMSNGGGGLPHLESGEYEIGIYRDLNAFDILAESGFDGVEGGFDGGEGGFFNGDGGIYEDGMIEGDVDFATFTGLTPGDFFSIDLIAIGGSVSNFQDDLANGGMIGLFDKDGTLMGADRGWDGQTRLTGIVPSSGNLNFAVTGSDDDGIWDDGIAFNGTAPYQAAGLYDIVLETQSIDGFEDITGVVVLPDANSFDSDLCGELTDCFVFSDLLVVEGQIVNLDPDIATGYDYSIVSGPGVFNSIMLPTVGGDSEFVITVDGMDYALLAGETFTFDHVLGAGNGIVDFSVSGIDPLEALDPLNPFAFIAAVTFSDTGAYDVTQTAQTQSHAVPEPSMLALFGAGLAGLGFVGGRRRKA